VNAVLEKSLLDLANRSSDGSLFREWSTHTGPVRGSSQELLVSGPRRLSWRSLEGGIGEGRQFIFVMEDKCYYVLGIETGNDWLWGVVGFCREDVGSLKDCVVGKNGGEEATLEDGEESLGEKSLHKSVSVSGVTNWERNIVDANTQGLVILLQAVGFGFKVRDDLVFGFNLLLESVYLLVMPL
jgi:hypothetical protein